MTGERQRARLDGFGDPIVDTALYFVQDARGFTGNAVMWWRPNAKGYTCDIDDAGQYIGAHVGFDRPTDVPWPVERVLALVMRVVDMQRLRKPAVAQARTTQHTAAGEGGG